jgi:hypothetical protein
MSYCRFRNTLLDLRDCASAISNREEISSHEEREAVMELVHVMRDFLDELNVDLTDDPTDNDIESRVLEVLDECEGDEPDDDDDDEVRK